MNITQINLSFFVIYDIIMKERLGVFMSNKTYDVLKWVALVGLYATATLVDGLGDIWSLPLTDEIVKTINLLGTVLGIVLGISNSSYKKKVK